MKLQLSCVEKVFENDEDLQVIVFDERIDFLQVLLKIVFQLLLNLESQVVGAEGHKHLNDTFLGDVAHTDHGVVENE